MLSVLERTLFALLLLGLQLCVTVRNAPGAERPNVILIMADDLGWGDVAYNGNPVVQTPCLDAMALEAVRLDRFYAAAPVCSPTRGSCLTGRHPYRYGIEWAGEAPLRPGELTIAETLREAGYATGHFGKWHVGGLSKTVKQSYFNSDSPPQDCAALNVRSSDNCCVGIKNTLVCFCSDNGPSYIYDYNSAGPFQGKKATLWEGGLRVPAIVEWPGRLPEGSVIDAPISTSDFYPTILAAAGIATPEGQPILDGINVMPLLEGRREDRGEPIAFQVPVKSEPDVFFDADAAMNGRADAQGRTTSNRRIGVKEAVPGSLQSAICDDRYKLISVDGGDRWRLFDLIADPGETNDLAEKQPERVRSMRTVLENWIESCERSERGEDYIQ